MKHSNGCGVQCIAEVTGKNPDAIRIMASGNFISAVEVVYILKKLGFKVKTPFRPTIFGNKKYIAIVPSLNTPGEFHFVVLSHSTKGVCVWDSNNGCEKKKYYVNQDQTILKKNEFRIVAWTSIIEVIKL